MISFPFFITLFARLNINSIASELGEETRSWFDSHDGYLFCRQAATMDNGTADKTVDRFFGGEKTCLEGFVAAQTLVVSEVEIRSEAKHWRKRTDRCSSNRPRRLSRIRPMLQEQLDETNAQLEIRFRDSVAPKSLALDVVEAVVANTDGIEGGDVEVVDGFNSAVEVIDIDVVLAVRNTDSGTFQHLDQSRFVIEKILRCREITGAQKSVEHSVLLRFQFEEETSAARFLEFQ